jgi:hypothetical protein
MTSPALPRDRIAARSVNAGRRAVPRPATSAPLVRIAGRYRHDLHDGGWRWSPEMFALHGLRPGDAEPSLELLLQRQHRADGEERVVVLMGEPDLDAAGAVLAVEGLCLDITDSGPPGSDVDRVHALQTEATQLRAAMASRATIEQAKGVLMLLTNCGDQAAFELLAHMSSHTHRKVRDVAQTITESAAGRTRLPEDLRAIIRDACPPRQPLH